MGFEHGECPHAGKRVLQLVIEESSVSASRSCVVKETPIAPSAIMKVSFWTCIMRETYLLQWWLMKCC